MDSLSSAESLQEYSSVPSNSTFPIGTTVYDLENGIEVENKSLQTPFGPKQFIQVRKPLPVKNGYKGVAYINDDVSVVDNKYNDDPFETQVHEYNHLKWEQFNKILHKKWGLPPMVSHYVKEIANRKITDDDVEVLTGKRNDTVTSYEKGLASSFMEFSMREFQNPMFGLYLARNISKLADDNYKILKSFNIDVRKDFPKVAKKPKKDTIRYVV
jgi:hypothetical protein